MYREDGESVSAAFAGESGVFSCDIARALVQVGVIRRRYDFASF
jgi:hypothetical protein